MLRKFNFLSTFLDKIGTRNIIIQLVFYGKSFCTNLHFISHPFSRSLVEDKIFGLKLLYYIKLSPTTFLETYILLNFLRNFRRFHITRVGALVWFSLTIKSVYLNTQSKLYFVNEKRHKNRWNEMEKNGGKHCLYSMWINAFMKFKTSMHKLALW